MYKIFGARVLPFSKNVIYNSELLPPCLKKAYRKRCMFKEQIIPT